MKTETFQIEGMSCGHCVRAVQQALEETDSVTVKQVEIGTATVAYDPERMSHDRLVEAIEDAGYTVAVNA